MSPINWSDSTNQPVSTAILQIGRASGSASASWIQQKKAYPNNWTDVCTVTLNRISNTSVFHFNLSATCQANKNNNIRGIPLLRLSRNGNTNDNATTVGGTWTGDTGAGNPGGNMYDTANLVHQFTDNPNTNSGQNVKYRLQLGCHKTGSNNTTATAHCGTNTDSFDLTYLSVMEVENDNL